MPRTLRSGQRLGNPAVVHRQLSAQFLVREIQEPVDRVRPAAQRFRSVSHADPRQVWFRDALLRQWAAADYSAVRMAQSVNEFVAEAGKEAAARRDRLRQVVGVGLEFHRQLLRELSGADCEQAGLPGDVTAASNWRGDWETAAACVDRCLDALAYVDRNANLVTLVECWLDDLSAMAVTGRPLVS